MGIQSALEYVDFFINLNMGENVSLLSFVNNRLAGYPPSLVCECRTGAATVQLDTMHQSLLMPKGGFEPPRACAHCALNAARLPVPPLRRGMDECPSFVVGGPSSATQSSQGRPILATIRLTAPKWFPILHLACVEAL